MKLDLSKKDYENKFGWVGSPECENRGAIELHLIAHRDEINVIGGIEDEEDSWSYDEIALVELHGQYYLLQTAGCSCPSPSETWEVVSGPASLDNIAETVLKGDYNGYTLPKNKEEELMLLIKSAAKL